MTKALRFVWRAFKCITHVAHLPPVVVAPVTAEKTMVKILASCIANMSLGALTCASKVGIQLI